MSANVRLREALVEIESKASRSRSVVVGLAILETFSAVQPLLGISEIAEQLEMSRSTTHRYAKTLVALGFLEQGVRHEYRLGARANDFGMSMLNSIGLRGRSGSYLRGLRDRVGFTVSLAVLDGSEIVYVARAYSHRKGQYQADVYRGVGARVPASCTAMGKVLLADLPVEERRDRVRATHLVACTPNSIVSEGRLEAELDRVSRKGFAVNNRELSLNMVAIAAPVRYGGAMGASIGIAANPAVISAMALASKCCDELLETADELANYLLGHTPPDSNSKHGSIL